MRAAGGVGGWVGAEGEGRAPAVAGVSNWGQQQPPGGDRAGRARGAACKRRPWGQRKAARGVGGGGTSASSTRGRPSQTRPGRAAVPRAPTRGARAVAAFPGAWAGTRGSTPSSARRPWPRRWASAPPRRSGKFVRGGTSLRLMAPVAVRDGACQRTQGRHACNARLRVGPPTHVCTCAHPCTHALSRTTATTTAA